MRPTHSLGVDRSSSWALIPLPPTHSERIWLISPYLCTAVSGTAAPPPTPTLFCTLTPPQCLWGSGVSHRAVMILIHEAVVVQRKDFRVFLSFLFFFNLQRLLFSPRKIWWVTFCPLTFRVKRLAIYWLSWNLEDILACGRVIHSSPILWAVQSGLPGMKQRLSGWFRPKVDETKTTM